MHTQGCVHYPCRGRPKKGESREFVRQWKILCAPRIDEEKLGILAELESVEMLITNIPRIGSGEQRDDVRDGASPETVLDLYLDQYKQEHTFRLLKSKVGFGNVYFQKPERENAMVFLLGLAAMVRNIIDHMFRENPGRFTTCQDMVKTWMFLGVRVVQGELEVDGPDCCELEMMDVMRRLELDEGIIVESISTTPS